MARPIGEIEEGKEERTSYFEATLDFLNYNWPENNRRDSNGLTSLHYLAVCGLTNIGQVGPSDLEVKLNEATEQFHQINSRNIWGRTPLHLAAATDRAHSTEILASMLEMNACAVNALDQWQLTPLHYAVIYSARSNYISLLLDNGANPELRDVKERTPFDIINEAEAWRDNPGHWSLKDTQWWSKDDLPLQYSCSSNKNSPNE